MLFGRGPHTLVEKCSCNPLKLRFEIGSISLTSSRTCPRRLMRAASSGDTIKRHISSSLFYQALTIATMSMFSRSVSNPSPFRFPAGLQGATDAWAAHAPFFRLREKDFATLRLEELWSPVSR